MRLWSSGKDQLLCFPGDTVMKNLPADTADARDTVRSLGQEDPLQGETAAHSSILAREISLTEELAGYSPCSCKQSGTAERASKGSCQQRRKG